jgi:hypothetical protein
MKALPLAKAVAGYLPRQKGAEGLLTPSQRANLGRHSWRHPEISNVFRECHQRTQIRHPVARAGNSWLI